MLGFVAIANPYAGAVPVTWYVLATKPGSDANPGTNWATAKATIQAAIDVSSDGDTAIVGNGVYSTGVIGWLAGRAP
jgi:hypothetical protein